MWRFQQSKLIDASSDCLCAKICEGFKVQDPTLCCWCHWWAFTLCHGDFKGWRGVDKRILDSSSEGQEFCYMEACWPQWSTRNVDRIAIWVMKGRSLVGHNIHRCQVCWRFDGLPYRPPPPPPPLPVFWVKESPLFMYMGIDFTEPLFVKGPSGSTKVCICLYTCCVVRAVHLGHSTWHVCTDVHS